MSSNGFGIQGGGGRNSSGGAVLPADGRYRAYTTLADGRSSLNVRHRTGSDVQILAPQEFPLRGISFSPDGDYLPFQDVVLFSGFCAARPPPGRPACWPRAGRWHRLADDP